MRLSPPAPSLKPKPSGLPDPVRTCLYALSLPSHAALWVKGHRKWTCVETCIRAAVLMSQVDFNNELNCSRQCNGYTALTKAVYRFLLCQINSPLNPHCSLALTPSYLLVDEVILCQKFGVTHLNNFHQTTILSYINCAKSPWINIISADFKQVCALFKWDHQYNKH